MLSGPKSFEHLMFYARSSLRGKTLDGIGRNSGEYRHPTCVS